MRKPKHRGKFWKDRQERIQQEQVRLLQEKRLSCFQKIYTERKIGIADGLCPTVWDNLDCWDPTPAGNTSRRRCPDYIYDLNVCEYSEKQCNLDGLWNPKTNYNACAIETNDTLCKASVKPLSELSEDIPNLNLIANIGYSVSLASLILAVILMVASKKTKSNANKMHVNLFLSFTVRSLMNILKLDVLVQGLGFEKDIRREGDRIIFIEEGIHWECKMFITLVHYGLMVSHAWVAVEAVYLHLLVYRTFQTDMESVKAYIVVGWFAPVIFIIPWVIVRATLADEFCWTIKTDRPELFWIIKGPISASIILNFFLFLNIIRILIHRIRKRTHKTASRKYRKFFKFTLVLIPMSGIAYLSFLGFPNERNAKMDKPHLYIEITYNSFQGFILAMLFCFLNEEVWIDLKKIWYRRLLRRGESLAVTATNVFKSWRVTTYPPQENAEEEEMSPKTMRARKVKSFHGFEHHVEQDLLKSVLSNAHKNSIIMEHQCV